MDIDECVPFIINCAAKFLFLFYYFFPRFMLEKKFCINYFVVKYKFSWIYGLCCAIFALKLIKKCKYVRTLKYKTKAMRWFSFDSRSLVNSNFQMSVTVFEQFVWNVFYIRMPIGTWNRCRALEWWCHKKSIFSIKIFLTSFEHILKILEVNFESSPGHIFRNSKMNFEP